MILKTTLTPLDQSFWLTVIWQLSHMVLSMCIFFKAASSATDI